MLLTFMNWRLEVVYKEVAHRFKVLKFKHIKFIPAKGTLTFIRPKILDHLRETHAIINALKSVIETKIPSKNHDIR